MVTNKTYDVVICGAGLAGLTLARQISNSIPSLTIALLDRLASPLPIAAFKVGESTTEIGSYYLADMLKLRDYMDQAHYRKLGLRFFFQNSEGHFHDRPEMGLTRSIAPYAYNFDRGLLESDLRHMVKGAGVELLENCNVRAIEIGSGAQQDHEIAYTQDGDPSPRRLAARWVIDAMGRRRFLQRKFKLTKANSERYNAAWFRMSGRVDIDNFVSSTEQSWHDRVPNHSRYYSTNHLCGPGYWIWLIGLSSDYTSIGLVADEAFHPFTQYNSYPKLYRWLQQHEPVLAAQISGRKPEDFLRMPRYSYSAKQVFSIDRWACVGEAATFVDPLYSTGTDMIGLANCLTTQLIASDAQHELDQEAVEQANLFFLSFNDGLANNISTAYSCMGHSLAMALKSVWDTMAGWAFTAPILFNSLYSDTQLRQQVWPKSGKFFSLAHCVQDLLQDWATSSTPRGCFEFIDYLELSFVKELRDRNLQPNKTDNELLADHNANIETFEEFAQVIFLLALEDTNPDKLAELPQNPWLNAWAINLDETRWRQDRLFSPISKPRDLRPMWNEFRKHIRFPTPAVGQLTKRLAIVQHAPLVQKTGVPKTLPEVLRRAADDDKGMVYVNIDGTDSRQNYQELLIESAKICAGLRARGKKPGDIVILQLSQNQDLIPALWGCLLGGFIATPISIPLDYQQSTSSAKRFWAAWGSLEKPIVVTCSELTDNFRTTSVELTETHGQLVTVEELRSNEPDYGFYKSEPDELAILLLTSGSTGVPKAVQLRHDSILTRAEGRKRYFDFSNMDVSVNWFPLDHVASLVMFHFRDVYLGCRQVHAPTQLVLKNPIRWIDWLSLYNATVSWAPNFAYALVIENEEKVNHGNWDLSSVRCLLNGGEPIDFKTVKVFLKSLAKHGLGEKTMYPDWGMTEIASGVVCPDPIDPSLEQTENFCLGPPIPGTGFRIVNDNDQIIREQQIGRVQVMGTTVTQGYFRDSARTTELFTADGWLQTGDLGFLNHGRLAITGREKEVIIVNGVNFDCHEIEDFVEQLDGVASSYTAACRYRRQDSQTDLLVIFFCSNYDQTELIAGKVDTIRQEVTKTFGVSPEHVIPVSPHEIPKSSIGKIQRGVLSQQLSSGAFDSIIESLSSLPSHVKELPETGIEMQIASVWSEIFKTTSTGVHDDFFEMGGDSLVAFKLINRLEESFGIEINIRDLFDAPTVRLLSERVTNNSQSVAKKTRVK